MRWRDLDVRLMGAVILLFWGVPLSVVLLSSCKAQPSASRTVPRQADPNFAPTVWYDEHHGVTCWVLVGANGYGISCIPNGQLKLHRKMP